MLYYYDIVCFLFSVYNYKKDNEFCVSLNSSSYVNINNFVHM